MSPHALPGRMATRYERSGARRAAVGRAALARALASYYGPGDDRTASARPGWTRDRPSYTSILTRPGWLDLGTPLIASRDRLVPVATVIEDGPTLDDSAAEGAARRLAETLVLGTRLVDMPLYRLLSIELGAGTIAGTLASDPLHAVRADDGSPGSGAVRLTHGRHDHAAAAGCVAAGSGGRSLDLRGRLCAGGVVALCAIARPASRLRGAADYVLLVQERSGSVLNAARRLAVIPKGFHQPMTDVRADAQLGATLRREMEEELFGRTDIDNTVTGDRRAADPMHPSRLSEPMRWLDEHPDRCRMECTGFGINLVSGNYEFAALVVIDDEEFWTPLRRHDRSQLGVRRPAPVLQPRPRPTHRPRPRRRLEQRRPLRLPGGPEPPRPTRRHPHQHTHHRTGERLMSDLDDRQRR